ncbi:hypothetical protein L596_000985 [Steinernema carpocapsae]|uniref:Uncharacterized protein n=1 Tax=Steinernema carpocapsae TaxID=34508 RepID=A0A4U8UK37_STECR|nr:hypothetical protein L596_000985 [Steinernema carpocapsae]
MKPQFLRLPFTRAAAILDRALSIEAPISCFRFCTFLTNRLGPSPARSLPRVLSCLDTFSGVFFFNVTASTKRLIAVVMQCLLCVALLTLMNK